MLAVTDTGTGMDQEVLGHLFEPFFTTKEPGKGTGLGLATVYGIVQQSGGYVSVYSEPGLGTTFKVYLPEARRSDRLEPEAVRRRKPDGGTEHVLLVEDEEAVRLLASTILDRAGYHVTAASNPRDAEALFHEQPIDVLVTDVVMPGGTGIELFQRLSLEKPELRVVYTSGYTDQAIADQVQPRARAGFLQKPFTADGLVARIREVLDR